MSEFQFDTSGTVDAAPGQYISVGDQKYPGVGWGILSPFVQGYTGAVLASIQGIAARYTAGGRRTTWRPGFSDLATETLARIMEDCAVMEARKPHSGDEGELDWGGGDHSAGGEFWHDRQAERWPASFPPQTVYLGDDGKVYLREMEG